jgi:hypothetical protein
VCETVFIWNALKIIRLRVMERNVNSACVASIKRGIGCVSITSPVLPLGSEEGWVPESAVMQHDWRIGIGGRCREKGMEKPHSARVFRQMCGALSGM